MAKIITVCNVSVTNVLYYPKCIHDEASVGELSYHSEVATHRNLGPIQSNF